MTSYATVSKQTADRLVSQLSRPLTKIVIGELKFVFGNHRQYGECVFVYESKAAVTMVSYAGRYPEGAEIGDFGRDLDAALSTLDE